MYTLKGTRIFLYLTPLQKRQFHSLDFWLTLETGIPAFIRDAEELPDVFGDSLDAVQESNHDTTGWGKPSFNPEETTPGSEDDSGEEWKKDE